MSGEQRDVRDLLRRWGSQPTPVADEFSHEERAARGQATISSAIRRARAEATRRRRWGACGGVAAAAALAVAVWFGSQGPPSTASSIHALDITAHDVSPGAQVIRHQMPLSLEHHVQVRVGDRVEAGPEGGLALRLADVTEARLERQAVLSIERLLEAEQLLSLHRGEASFDVDPKRQNHVVIETADAVVTVVGTAFRVTTGDDEGDPWTTVAVARGKVAVQHDGRRRTLTAGDSWTSRQRVSERAELDPKTSSETVAGTTADTTALASGDSPPSEARSAEPASARSRPAGTPSAASAQGRVRRGHASTDASRSEGAAVSASSDPATLAAEVRLFRSAIGARNRGNDARCVGLLEAFLAQYPRSPLRQEATIERFRALHRLGKTAEAARVARRYLAEHDSGIARDEARQVVLTSEQHESSVEKTTH